MAAMGISSGTGACRANIPEVDPDNMAHAENETDVLVVGSGMAGLFAAIKAHDAGARVLMVSKGRLGASGQTPFARGIFAYDPATARMTPRREPHRSRFTSCATQSPRICSNELFSHE